LIFTIEHSGADYFPVFGLAPEKNYKPYPAFAAILEVFARTRNGWNLVYWFADLNSFLVDKRPQYLLACQPEQVIAAAKDAMEGPAAWLNRHPYWNRCATAKYTYE
jgi:hypothetical protein